MFLTAAFGVVVNVAMAVLLFEHHSHGLPGAACRGHAHAHGEKHSHTMRPAAVKAKVSGYGTLEQAEEVPSAKDTCLEAGKVELAAGESVAVVVHCHDDGQPPGSQDSHPQEGDHQDNCAPHVGAAQTGQNDAGVNRGALTHVLGPDESNVPHNAPSVHPGQAAPSAVSQGDPRSCTAGGQASRAHCHPPQEQHHTGGATLHPPRHAHPHSHSCSHSKGPQRAVPSHPAVPAVKLPGPGPEPPSPDPFTALFSPLQLFSEAPSFPSPKLESGSPAKEDTAGWHGHAEGECEGGHPHRKQNINLRGAFVHVLGDLVQSVGVMVAGAIIWVKPEW
jgi:Co/Zn/Cd efflux system component